MSVVFTCVHNGRTIPITIHGVDKILCNDGLIFVTSYDDDSDGTIWERKQFDAFALHEVREIKRID